MPARLQEFETIDELEKWFVKNIDKTCFVSESIRNVWLLNHCMVDDNGKLKSLTFKNIGGTVYQAVVFKSKKNKNG